MNAFTRQETTALHLTGSRKPAAWKSEQPDSVRQQITYLPIVDAHATRIVGYQAAADTGHSAFDCMRTQIMNSPASGLLLMELDAADCLARGRCQTNHLCALFMQEAWTERELVIQLRGSRHGAWQSAQMQKRLQAVGIAIAVSWDGGLDLLGIDTLIDARVITFEARLLQPDSQHSAAKAVTQVLHAARKLGIQTMLAGVSDGEEMQKARELGFDWLQGPLFNRLKVCG